MTQKLLNAVQMNVLKITDIVFTYSIKFHYKVYNLRYC